MSSGTITYITRPPVVHQHTCRAVPLSSSSGTHHSWAYCLSAGLTPAVFGTDWKGASSARGQAPQDPAGCCSKCLPSPKSSAEVLSIRVWKQRLLLQNPPHHKLPLSLSVPLPVRIIFPVQLLFFTPACSFSLNNVSCCKFGGKQRILGGTFSAGYCTRVTGNSCFCPRFR